MGAVFQVCTRVLRYFVIVPHACCCDGHVGRGPVLVSTCIYEEGSRCAVKQLTYYMCACSFRFERGVAWKVWTMECLKVWSSILNKWRNIRTGVHAKPGNIVGWVHFWGTQRKQMGRLLSVLYICMLVCCTWLQRWYIGWFTNYCWLPILSEVGEGYWSFFSCDW